MIQALQSTSKGLPQIDTQTLVHYASYAEFYNLSSALLVLVQMCAKYDDQLLKQAGYRKSNFRQNDDENSPRKKQTASKFYNP